MFGVCILWRLLLKRGFQILNSRFCLFLWCLHSTMAEDHCERKRWKCTSEKSFLAWAFFKDPGPLPSCQCSSLGFISRNTHISMPREGSLHCVGTPRVSSLGRELSRARVGGTFVCQTVFTGIVEERLRPFLEGSCLRRCGRGGDFVPFWNNHGKEVMWPVDFAMMGAEERRTRHAKSLSLEPESRVPCGHMMVLGSLTSQTILFSLRLCHFKNTKMHS